MSLITRCPACRTMFKVVPDQLKISEGWVRCGKCDEIFDAAAHLQDSAVAQEPRHETTTAPVFQSELTAALATEAMPLAASAARAKPVAVAERIEPQLEPEAGDTTILLPEGSAYGMDETRPLVDEPPPQRPSPPQAAAQAAPELSFMRSARKSSRWHRPLVRASLLVMSLVLLLGLALQLLVQERDAIAAREPGLRPLIAEACLLMGCEIKPLRQIESVVIDSSAFSKIKGDLYRLSLTLKNNAPIDLAMPAVELALTDTLDHALIRRVLPPEELGVRNGVIRAGGEAQATLMLTVKTNGNGERIAGYRLLAFYP